MGLRCALLNGFNYGAVCVPDHGADRLTVAVGDSLMVYGQQYFLPQRFGERMLEFAD